MIGHIQGAAAASGKIVLVVAIVEAGAEVVIAKPGIVDKRNVLPIISGTNSGETTCT